MYKIPSPSPPPFPPNIKNFCSRKGFKKKKKKKKEKKRKEKNSNKAKNFTKCCLKKSGTTYFKPIMSRGN